MRRTWVQQVMGMPVSLLLRGPELAGAGAETAVAAAFDELRAVDALFSTYRLDSEVSKIRRGELTREQASPLVREVLGLCELARVRSDGWFDVELPGGLDPSGLVKGWALERALTRVDLDVDVCLNIAGDVGVRLRPGATPFVAGIEDPQDRRRLLTSVPLAAGGLATSGTAARGAHIIDPHTGRPVEALASISVVGPSLLWADVWATASFARGPAALAWLASQAGYEALLVHRDGRVETTAGWPGPAGGQPAMRTAPA